MAGLSRVVSSFVTNNFEFLLQNGDYQGVSTSRLKYVPNIEDDGRYLTCRVIIRGKAEKVLEDSWEIKVLCKYVYSCK
jgi:hypothetical protein